ncbi:MAG: BlaI/MecI/CopY family transcriptional regulator [Lachnospiraceae bacterium]|nr:BlaI/MecI/CopY family transcriptional regulator [Lachnospiraceae bacterium]
MSREEMLPSESEWMIMETLWRCGHDLTSSEIADRLPKSSKMTQRMVRVLINRLCKKGMLTYTVDEEDSRVYHYTAVRSREECRKAKSITFVDSYFEGNRLSAAFTLLDNEKLSKEQIRELENIIEKAKKNK